MLQNNRALMFLGAFLWVLVMALAVVVSRAEPFFFLSGVAPERVEPIVEARSDGLALYVQLLGPNGQATRCDGQLLLTIRSGQDLIYREVRQVRHTDFAQVRLSGLQDWALAYGWGWLDRHEKLPDPPAGPVQVEVHFIAATGASCTGKAICILPD
jgi:hypothetical protein